MDRSVPEGGRVAASEQLQPLYDVKNLVGQQQSHLQAILAQMQVLLSGMGPLPLVSSGCTSIPSIY